MRVLLLGILLACVSFVGCTKDAAKPADPVTPTPAPAAPATPTPAAEVTKEKTVVVHFNFNSAKLGKDQKKIIKDAVAGRKDGTKVTLVGHTDSQGSKAFNKKLSEKRAKAVSKYLDSLKVANTWTATGSTDLLNKDKTVAEHKLNRRADVSFTVVVK